MENRDQKQNQREQDQQNNQRGRRTVGHLVFSLPEQPSRQTGQISRRSQTS